MFYPMFEGKLLIPSKSAMRELVKLGLTLDDCSRILEEGREAPRRRAAQTIEKWVFAQRKKIINVVVVKSFNFLYNEDVWLITHVGIFSRR